MVWALDVAEKRAGQEPVDHRRSARVGLRAWIAARRAAPGALAAAAGNAGSAASPAARRRAGAGAAV